MKKKNVVVYCIIGILAVVVVALCMQWILPKNIHSFLKGQDVYVMGCAVSKDDVSQIELNLEDSQRLMDVLEATDFYYNGRSYNRMYGNLYHVQFGVENDGWWTGTLGMFISDEGIAYIDGKRYRIRSEKDVIAFLESLF